MTTQNKKTPWPTDENGDNIPLGKLPVDLQRTLVRESLDTVAPDIERALGHLALRHVVSSKPQTFVLTIEDATRPGRKWTEEVYSTSAEEATRLQMRILDKMGELDCGVTSCVPKGGAK